MDVARRFGFISGGVVVKIFQKILTPFLGRTEILYKISSLNDFLERLSSDHFKPSTIFSILKKFKYHLKITKLSLLVIPIKQLRF